ncbi:HAD family hydrolase [Lagierella sp.]|uniref:HAD family hydrolase n=1 Tax=Lagierella sp. TaxID=2849657 RepID=UPI002606FFB4|nr:HAD family hydrolase [Lagierella sp.]
MKIRGVIFDKDGTLIEFSDLWRSGLEEFFEKNFIQDDLKREIRRKVGIKSDCTIEENSILASGTMDDLVSVISQYVSLDKGKLYKKISDHYLSYMKRHPDMIKETCDLRILFEKLKELGIKIGVITADDYVQAKLCLEILGIENHIGFLATGDRYLNKPNTQSLDAFCEKFSLNRREVAIVGDSEIDMLLGKKAGLAIGVLSGVGTKDMLTKSADILVKSPCEVISSINSNLM